MNPMMVRLTVVSSPRSLVGLEPRARLGNACFRQPNAALHLHRGAVPRRCCPTPTALPGVRCKRLFGPPQRHAGHPPAGPARGPSPGPGAALAPPPDAWALHAPRARPPPPCAAATWPPMSARGLPGWGVPPSPPMGRCPRAGLRKTERRASAAAGSRSEE